MRESISHTCSYASAVTYQNTAHLAEILKDRFDKYVSGMV